MKKNEQLVKHHFWILFGVAPVLVGLAFLLMWIFVSGAVTEQRNAYAKSLKDLSLDPKTAGEVKAKEAQKEVLTKQKDELWSANYLRQDAARVFDWPTGGNRALQQHSDKKYKFGDQFLAAGNETSPLNLEAAFNKGYDRLSEDLAPTRFAGGHWKTALRYVSNWGKMSSIEPPVLWLALEDYWAQKALLLPIAELNDAAAKFADVTPKEANSPLKRKFRNRVWELDLEVYEDGRKRMMKGELRNVTDRLQVIGMGKSMRVNVWLDDAKNNQPDFAFLIQGENVAGRGKLTCTPREITSTGPVNGIVRVEQVFDAATAPVRLVNTIELGLLDHKNRAAVLEVPKHLESAEGDTTTTPAAALPGEGGPGGGTPDGMTMPGGPPGGGMMGMMGASGGSGKSGSPATVLLGNKKRYLKRTEDVRRMPVALSLVMDRDFVNDLLISYANSVLRFQVTQTQWQRYRDALPPVGSGSSVGGPGGNIPGMGGPSAGGPGGTGTSDGEDGGRSGYGSMMMQRGGPGAKGGGPAGPPGGGGPGVTGTLSASDDDMVPPEANAGLVELAVFGVISLYEKKLATPPGAAPPAGEQPAGEKPAGEQPVGEKPMGEKAPAGEKPTGEKAAPAATPPTGEKAPAPTPPTGEKEKAPATGEKAPPATDKPPMTPAGAPTQPPK